MGQQQPLDFRRVKVRITRAGGLYIGLTLFLGAAAVNTMNNLLYLVVATLLALMAVSGVIAYLSLRRMGISVRTPREIFAQTECSMTIVIHNHRRRLPTYLLRIESDAGSTEILEIPAQSSSATTLPFVFPTRGRHPLGTLTITTSFPLGLFHRGGLLSTDVSALVYPQPCYPPPELPVRSGHSAGEAASNRAGFGGDYRGSRPYQPGDGPRHIDWKAAARTGGLLTKEFEEEGSRPVVVSLEDVPGTDLEHRIARLTALVLEADREGRPMGLRLNGTVIGPNVGPSARERLLRSLALYPNVNAVEP